MFDCAMGWGCLVAVCLRHNEFLSTRVPSDCVLWIPARYRSKVDWSVIGPRLADNGEPGNGERSNAHVLCLWGGVCFELLWQNIITCSHGEKYHGTYRVLGEGVWIERMVWVGVIGSCFCVRESVEASCVKKRSFVIWIASTFYVRRRALSAN